jgi:hypothetical protein
MIKMSYCQVPSHQNYIANRKSGNTVDGGKNMKDDILQVEKVVESLTEYLST